MKPSKRQIILEAVEYVISGFLLLLAVINQSFQYVIVILVFQYVWSIINTIGWWTWLNGSATKTGEP